MRLALLFSLALTAGAAWAETPAEGLSAARQAWADGKAGLAYRLSHQVLVQAPDDPAALLIVAAAAPHVGRAAEGRHTARLAWRLAPTSAMKHEAARTAAAAALAEGREGLAQLWLRRALLHAAPGDQTDRTGRDLARLRRMNPVSLSFDLSAAPSSNLNDGAESANTQTDWVPERLSASAQALSGWRATAGVTLMARVRETETSRTRLGFQLYGTVNQLSQEARDKIAADVAAGQPRLTGSDLNYTLAEARAEHRFLAGPLPATLNLAAGRSWYGGDPYASHLRVGLAETLPIGRMSALQLALTADRQMPERSASVDSLGLGATWLHQTASGATLRLGVNLRGTDSAAVNSSYRGARIEAGWAPANAIGPVQVEARIAAGLRDYAAYDMGVFMVEGGRQDESLEAGLDMTLPRAGLAGFAPTIGLEARRNRSNVGRFNTREIGVTFGFRSLF